MTAQSAVQIAGVNRISAILFNHKLRELVFLEVEAEAPELLRDQIEVDDRYFGGQQKGKCRCGAGKVNVCGLFKRQGKVHVVIIPDVRSDTLIPIIPEKIKSDSIVCADAFRSYDVLDISEFRHLRINHSVLFADQHNHINGIENFWNQAKHHLRSYQGIAEHHFSPFIKECE